MKKADGEGQNDNNLEDKIARNIAEAKLDIAEKRLHFVLVVAGAVLTIFGVILPLWLSNRTTDKVDGEVSKMKQDINMVSTRLRDDSKATAESLEKAIYAIRSDLRADMEGQSRQIGSANMKVDAAVQDMQSKFKELAGAQLRKPVLQCLLDGSDLQGRKISFYSNTDKNMMVPAMKTNAILQIKNIGDAPARNLRLEFYTVFNNCEHFGMGMAWSKVHLDEEPTYSCGSSVMLPSLDPKQSTDVTVPSFDDSVKPGEYPTILKVFYEQVEPRRYSFTISVSGRR